MSEVQRRSKGFAKDQTDFLHCIIKWTRLDRTKVSLFPQS